MQKKSRLVITNKKKITVMCVFNRKTVRGNEGNLINHSLSDRIVVCCMFFASIFILLLLLLDNMAQAFKILMRTFFPFIFWCMFGHVCSDHHHYQHFQSDYFTCLIRPKHLPFLWFVSLLRYHYLVKSLGTISLVLVEKEEEEKNSAGY